MACEIPIPDPTDRALPDLLIGIENSSFRLFIDVARYGAQPSSENLGVIATTATTLTGRMSAIAEHILQLDSPTECKGTMLQGVHNIEATQRANRFNTHIGTQLVTPSVYCDTLEDDDPNNQQISEEDRTEIVHIFTDHFTEGLSSDLNAVLAYLRNTRNTRARRAGKVGLQTLKYIGLVTAGVSLSALAVHRLDKN